MRRKIAFILVAAICLVPAASCGSRSFDAEELATIEVVGAEGFGTLIVVPDQTRISGIVEEEASRIKETDEKALQRLFRREAALNSLVYTADRMTNLKNGDEITIQAGYDGQLARSAGIRFRKVSFKYRVGNLKDAIPIDVRNNVAVVFSGFDGQGVASLQLSGDMEVYRGSFEFDFSREPRELKNGDSLGLKVTPDNDQLTGKGRIARNVNLSFKVSGLLPMTSVDLFRDLVLVYDGISDHGTLSFDTTRLPAEWVEAGGQDEAPVRFVASPSTGLSNGDQVKVQALIDEAWFAGRGMEAQSLDRLYEVEGLKDFPRNLDQVDLLPLFDRIGDWVDGDIDQRLAFNYWNQDFKTGEPVSQWDYDSQYEVSRIFYGYENADRSNNFVAILYKVAVEGTCVSTKAYQSSYEEGDQLSSTLYLIYLVERVMYDRNAIDDFRGVNLGFHSDVELDAIAQLKNQLGGAGMQLVDVPLPQNLARGEPDISVE